MFTSLQLSLLNATQTVFVCCMLQQPWSCCSEGVSCTRALHTASLHRHWQQFRAVYYVWRERQMEKYKTVNKKTLPFELYTQTDRAFYSVCVCRLNCEVQHYTCEFHFTSGCWFSCKKSPQADFPTSISCYHFLHNRLLFIIFYVILLFTRLHLLDYQY